MAYSYSPLVEIQRLPTTGARAVAPFELDGIRWLAIPQLAVDRAGTPEGINGGSSDAEVLLFAEGPGGFAAQGALPVGAGEDVEIFTIGGRTFAAVAAIRTGDGPYDYSAVSAVFEWGADGFRLHQELPTYGAKQARHFRVGEQDFLGIAQGMPGGDLTSTVLRWDGERFQPFQDLPSVVGYNIAVFEIDGVTYLAHADHAAPSLLYRFDETTFVEHQELIPAGGRAFLRLDDSTDSYLAVACINADSVLLKWDGGRFGAASVIPGGPGGREFARIEGDAGTFVVRVDFIHGTPADPQPDLDSHIYRFDGGALHPIGAFRTTGGTDVAVLPGDGLDLAVSNGLSAVPVPGRTFAAETVIYRFRPPASVGEGVL